MGSITLNQALDSKDPNVGKLKVVSMLESLPGVGKVKARRVMDEVCRLTLNRQRLNPPGAPALRWRRC